MNTGPEKNPMSDYTEALYEDIKKRVDGDIDAIVAVGMAIMSEAILSSKTPLRYLDAAIRATKDVVLETLIMERLGTIMGGKKPG